MAMGFLDTAMAGHYSATDLAGVALGGNILWPIFMLTAGVTMALTPITAQLRGADRVQEIGALVRQGIWIAFGASLVTVVVAHASTISTVLVLYTVTRIPYRIP